jgi:hypothetical protein
MREYQVVIIRLSGKSREDEEALTDLLNERARMGWADRAVQILDGQKVLVVFTRET